MHIYTLLYRSAAEKAMADCGTAFIIFSPYVNQNAPKRFALNRPTLPDSISDGSQWPNQGQEWRAGTVQAVIRHFFWQFRASSAQWSHGRRKKSASPADAQPDARSQLSRRHHPTRYPAPTGD